jgi:hypothetical protein
MDSMMNNKDDEANEDYRYLSRKERSSLLMFQNFFEQILPLETQKTILGPNHSHLLLEERSKSEKGSSGPRIFKVFENSSLSSSSKAAMDIRSIMSLTADKDKADEEEESSSLDKRYYPIPIQLELFAKQFNQFIREQTRLRKSETTGNEATEEEEEEEYENDEEEELEVDEDGQLINEDKAEIRAKRELREKKYRAREDARLRKKFTEPEEIIEFDPNHPWTGIQMIPEWKGLDGKDFYRLDILIQRNNSFSGITKEGKEEESGILEPELLGFLEIDQENNFVDFPKSKEDRRTAKQEIPVLTREDQLKRKFYYHYHIQKMMTRKEEQQLPPEKKTIPLLRLVEKGFIQGAGKFQLNSLFQSILHKLPEVKLVTN